MGKLTSLNMVAALDAYLAAPWEWASFFCPATNGESGRLHAMAKSGRKQGNKVLLCQYQLSSISYYCIFLPCAKIHKRQKQNLRKMSLTGITVGQNSQASTRGFY